MAGAIRLKRKRPLKRSEWSCRRRSLRTFATVRDDGQVENEKWRSDLARIAAEKVATCLEGVPIGAQLALDSSSALCDTLEVLLPEVLRGDHPEWDRESLDGFFFSSTLKSGERAAELAGTCTLISDQTVTPFALTFNLSGSREFRSLRIRLGESGGGPLGISGPDCNSRAAQEMLLAINARMDLIDWVYDVTVVHVQGASTFVPRCGDASPRL